MEQKQTYVGIDVSKAQGGCRRPAYRPEMGRFLRRDRVRRTGLPDGGSGSLPSAAGGFGWSGTALGGSPGSCGAAGSRRQPPSGSRLRQGHRQAGQDRRSGRGGPGPFRRRHSSLRAPSEGRRGPGSQLSDCPQTPGDDHAGLGEEPVGYRHQRRPPPH